MPLAGVSRQSWRLWRDRAIAHGLIKRQDGVGLVPLVSCHEGQFARVPVSTLLDRRLSRMSRRVGIALALFRDGFTNKSMRECFNPGRMGGP